MSTPSKSTYKEALETVKAYEKRQNELKKLNRVLGNTLKHYFATFKFDIDKERKIVVFAGIAYDGKLKLSKAICNPSDKFEVVIGKLVAVQKSVGENIDWIEKFIEKENWDWHIVTKNLSANNTITFAGTISSEKTQ